MRRCLYCDARLPGTDPEVTVSGRRQAYDPTLGRLWDVCSRCWRWSPVPLELRWEAVEEWEERVRREGRTVLETSELALLRVGKNEVVRVGRPPPPEWGGWRYGSRLIATGPAPSFFSRLVEVLPPPPLEGYDPYGLTGPLGGVGGKSGPLEWLASPFLESARPLTLAFTSFPFARECPACGGEMPLYPWDFQEVTLRTSEGRAGVEAPCGSCGELVLLDLRDARPAIRLGLAVLDSGPEARKVGESAGEALDRAGGRSLLLRGLGELGTALGDLGRTERVALGIALDEDAEGEALEAEWREAEEVAAILDNASYDGPAFQAFRARVLGRLRT
ncbi:MAG: hypothetical protein WEG36_00625 [Gemmatimonadota bacterium]